MNIAFWSTTAGRNGTTHNMMALSLAISFLYPIKSIMIHTGKDARVWERNYLENRHNNHMPNVMYEDFSYYGNKGIDDIIENSRLRNITEGMLYDNMIKVKNKDIYYIPSSRRLGMGIREEEAALKFPDIMKRLNNINDMNFYDVKSGNDRLSKSVLDEADIVVINICQNGFSFEDFSRIPDSIRKKSIYVIGRYDEASKFNIDELRKKLRIEKADIGIIPYSVEYCDAVESGNIIDYFEKLVHSGAQPLGRNAKNPKEERAQKAEFLAAMRDTAQMILRKAGYDV